MKLVVMAAIAVAGAGLAAAPAMAQDTTYTGMYGNLGFNDTNAQGSNTEGVVGRIGGRFTRYLGVEGEFNVGLNGGGKDVGPAPATHVGVKQKYGGAAYAVGFLPVTRNVDLLARVGYGASKFRINPAGAPAYNATENGIRYGAGVQMMAYGSNGVRFDYTREHLGNMSDPGGYFSGDKNANVWSVSLVHKF